MIYSVPINEKRKGESQVYRHPDSRNGLTRSPEGINNLADFWDLSVQKFPKNKLIEDYTFSEVDAKVKSVGSWFLKQNHDKVFIYCKNCPEWTLTDLAAWNYGSIIIPLYDTLGNEAFDHILKLTEGTSLATLSDMSANLLKNLTRSKANIKTVIIFDHPFKI